MIDYIEREAASAVIRRLKSPTRSPAQNELIRMALVGIKGISAADVAPVRHGWWIPEEHEDRVSPTMTHKYRWYHCSLCGRRLIGFSNPKDAPYCHCGAKMDGGGDHA